MIIGVVVRDGNKQYPMEKFKDPETLRQFCSTIRTKYPKGKIYLVNCTKASPPPDKVHLPKAGNLWCPYCTDYRRFKLDTYLNIYRCEICGISTQDFYVHKYNRNRLSN